MKKLFAILMAAVLLLGCASAVAEGEPQEIEVNGSFRVTYQVPDGYVVESEFSDDKSIFWATMYPKASAEDKTPLRTGLNMIVGISYDDTSNGASINDYSDEEIRKNHQAELDAAGYENATFDIVHTNFGTKLIVDRIRDDNSESLVITSLWKGYVINAIAFYANEDDDTLPVTDAQAKTIVDFISNIWMFEGGEVKEEKPAQ